jgi:hypothetical protein
MINDIDLILFNHAYFHYCFEKAYTTKKFIVGRKKSNQYFMGFNFANPEIWGEIFNINDINDVYEVLLELFSFGVFWGTDQLILQKHVNNNKKQCIIIDNLDLYCLLDINTEGGKFVEFFSVIIMFSRQLIYLTFTETVKFYSIQTVVG